MEKIQQEFEEWAIKHHFSVTKNTDGASYVHDSTMCAFEGWKASRSALCVELPSFENGSIRGYSGDCDEARMVVDSVAESLDKAGVSHK